MKYCLTLASLPCPITPRLSQYMVWNNSITHHTAQFPFSIVWNLLQWAMQDYALKHFRDEQMCYALSVMNNKNHWAKIMTKLPILIYGWHILENDHSYVLYSGFFRITKQFIQLGATNFYWNARHKNNLNIRFPCYCELYEGIWSNACSLHSCYFLSYFNFAGYCVQGRHYIFLKKNHW